MSNYATKAALKHAAGVDTLDIGKLETTSVDLSKLSNVVKNDVIKKFNAIQKNLMLVSLKN